MKVIFFYVIISMSTLLFFCNPDKGSIEVAYIEDLHKLFQIGFDEINRYDYYHNGNMLNIKDSLFLGDDDTEWKGKCFFYNQKIIFIAENNWSQKDSISIIQILNPGLKTTKGIGVHSLFAEAKPEINFDTWKNFSDGYIMFKDKYNPKLIYDFGATEGLVDLALDKDTFPEKSIITAILLKR